MNAGDAVVLADGDYLLIRPASGGYRAYLEHEPLATFDAPSDEAACAWLAGWLAGVDWLTATL